jgi:hypothetical protein
VVQEECERDHDNRVEHIGANIDAGADGGDWDDEGRPRQTTANARHHVSLPN